MDIEITEQQGKAIMAVVDWYHKPWKRFEPSQVFKLFGAAGTGKTTLAKYIADSLGINVLYVAFTGKAALVLASKDCKPSATIHSTIYKASQNEVTGRWSYVLNYEKLLGVDLVLLDEAPMVGETLALDLLKVSGKVLALGDPYQLGPVNDNGYFGIGDPDFLLTDIHRQAKDNPIIALSMLAREGGRLTLGNYGSSRVLKAKTLDYAMLEDHTQALVGKNDTRKYINDMYREGAGLHADYGWLPAPSERLICLRNNRERGFLNGQMWVTTKASQRQAGGDVASWIVPEDDEGTDENLILTPEDYYRGQEQFLDWRVRKDADEFCYAYGITVHKSQGSSYPDVLLLDQSRVFKEDAFRWLYTGITRASERLTVLI